MSAPPPSVDRTALAAAVREANLPILLMVLVHLSGDLRWLQPPYQPTRPRGMDDHDSGDLPDDVQETIRSSAVAAIAAALDGREPAIERPDTELLQRMLNVCMGEPVPPEFVRMMQHEMGFEPDPETRQPALAAAEDLPILIVGAGASGICAAIELRAAGFAVEIAEKEDELGGVWAANRYPGAGVDTPSHLYSFSFALHPWPGYFAKRDDVHAYLQRVAGEFGVEPLIRFGTEVVALRFEAAEGIWRATLRGPGGEEERRYRFVITAVGQLNRPKIPALPGLEDFRGPWFHSAEWPADLELKDRTVAVVGTGASAMQIVPAIHQEVRKLIVFQRSPQWAVGNDKYFQAVSPRVQLLLDVVPFYARWYRCRLAWIHNDRVHASLQIDPEWSHPERSLNEANDAHRRYFSEYIAGEVGDRPDLLARVLPDYPPFGKRMLIDNGWFETLRSEKVELISSPVASVTPSGVVDGEGREHDVDVLVLATGFESFQLLAPIAIEGRNGVGIRDVWGVDDPRAYLGTLVPGFPNLFCLYGPNTNLGHGGSWLSMVESQVHYVRELLLGMLARGASTVEVRGEEHDAYNAEIDRRHGAMIWSHPGMDTWYRNDAGRVVSNWPGRVVDYWDLTREPQWDHLVLDGADGVAIGQTRRRDAR